MKKVAIMLALSLAVSGALCSTTNTIAKASTLSVAQETMINPSYYFSQPMLGVVNVSTYLNVRTGPTTNYTIIGYLYNNTRVYAIGYDMYDTNWYYIKYATAGTYDTFTYGWVNKNYLSILA